MVIYSLKIKGIVDLLSAHDVECKAHVRYTTDKYTNIKDEQWNAFTLFDFLSCYVICNIR